MVHFRDTCAHVARRPVSTLQGSDPHLTELWVHTVGGMGEDAARLCKETETEYQLGRKKGRVVIAKSAVKEVVGEALFNDPTKCCPFDRRWGEA